MIRAIVNAIVFMIIASFVFMIFPYSQYLFWQKVTQGFDPNSSPQSIMLLFELGNFIIENLNFIAVMFIAYQILIYATRRSPVAA